MPPPDPSSFWRDRPVFVTGGTGFVGSWLVKRLLELGAHVVCLVRDWVPESELMHSGAIGRVTLVRGDLCDAALLERILGEYQIDTVFHLAAQAIVGVANKNPLSTFHANIEGTWLLLEACRRAAVRSVVIASSDKAYGEHETLPYTETMALQGRHPYDVSKSCADLIAQSYAVSFGLPVAITRCGNYFGGGDLNWNRVVPGTVRSLLKNERPLLRSDGTFVRDYLYVEDGVEAYLLTAEQLSASADLKGQAFNFSYGKPLAVLDVVQKITALIGSDLKPDIRNEASNEIPRQYLDSSKAQKVLGWAPRFGFDEAMQRTIQWYREYFSQNTSSH
ncbi:MAG: GDP-mannose 4,6-dehydratase [Candidatus Peregrinibacteria bacterium]